jgi:hypothetical protein
MRQRLFILGYLFIFWIAFAVVIRGLFLLYNHDLSQQLVAQEIFRIFLNGLRMDVSLSGYVLMASGLILTLSLLFETRWLFFALHVTNIVFLVIGAIIASIDFELYRHWGFRMNTAPLFYVQSAGSAVLGSVEVTAVFKVLLLCGSLIAIFLFIYDRFLIPQIKSLPKGKPRDAMVLAVVTALMIIPIRGSFTVAPMNTGFVYFHKTNTFENHAEINVIWKFLYYMRKSDRSKYD